jgi:MerC mercury resistance protein
MLDKSPNSNTSGNNPGRLAPLFAIFAFLACNGSILLIGALSALGISISINPHLQAAAISLFSLVALLLVVRDFRNHRSISPVILAALASATLISTMYIYFDKLVESIGLLALFTATLWSWWLNRRQGRTQLP